MSVWLYSRSRGRKDPISDAQEERCTPTVGYMASINRRAFSDQSVHFESAMDPPAIRASWSSILNFLFYDICISYRSYRWRTRR